MCSLDFGIFDYIYKRTMSQYGPSGGGGGGSSSSNYNSSRSKPHNNATRGGRNKSSGSSLGFGNKSASIYGPASGDDGSMPRFAQRSHPNNSRGGFGSRNNSNNRQQKSNNNRGLQQSARNDKVNKKRANIEKAGELLLSCC